MVSDQLSSFDLGMQRSLFYITRSSISNLAWMQASLPIHLGSLGLRSAQSSAVVAFVGSCNASRQLVNQLLGYSSKSLSSGLDDASLLLQWIWLKFREKLMMKDLLCQQLSSVLPATSKFMFQHEFIVAIKLWLGIPIFPAANSNNALRCICG